MSESKENTYPDMDKIYKKEPWELTKDDFISERELIKRLGYDYDEKIKEWKKTGKL